MKKGVSSVIFVTSMSDIQNRKKNLRKEISELEIKQNKK